LKRRTLGALAGLAVLLASPVCALEKIIIDQGYDDQTRIAIVPFTGGVAGDDDIADIIAFDLARSGQFDPLEPENMLSMPSHPEDVLFRDWRTLKMEYVVIGRLWRNDQGDLTAAWHLYDVFNERELIAGNLTAPPAKLRDVAHRIADEVYERITGVPGAFSTRIVYVLATDAGTAQARYRLKLADSDGARARTLFNSDQPLLSASWSPDARRVAYVSFESGRPAIIVQDVVTGARERVAEYRGLNGAPVFSPDGQRLALVLSRDGNPEIYVMDLAGDRSLRRITRYPGAIDTEPSWSPDGESLIFTSDRGGRPQIYRIELANSMIERLTFQGDYNARARLLPEGRHLIYVHRRRGTYHIAWQDLERDDVRVLTETSLDESPSIAPNGMMLIYATQNAGRGILAVVSIDGRVKYWLPSDEGDVREPAWSPYIDALSPSSGL